MNTESEKKTADNKIINFENVVNIKIKQIVSSERNINKEKEILSNEENKKQTSKGQETVKSNTISGAIFAMTALSIGTGCLTFTKKIIQFGFVWFGVTLILGGIATYWTLSGLIRAARKRGDSEYSSIVKKELGSFPAMLVDVMTCLYSWGLIITYEIIMNTLVGRVIYVFFKDDEPIYPTFGIYEDKVWDKLKIKAIVLGTINIVLIPLCILKDISKMKFFSLFGIISLFYTIFVLVIQSYFYWNHYLDNVYVKDDSSTHANWYDITKAFNGNLDFLYYR